MLMAWKGAPEKLVENSDSWKIKIFNFISGNSVQKKVITYTEKYSDLSKPVPNTGQNWLPSISKEICDKAIQVQNPNINLHNTAWRGLRVPLIPDSVFKTHSLSCQLHSTEFPKQS